jgi:hypothetical protein
LEKDIVLETGSGAGWQRRPMNPKFVIWLIAIVCVMSLIFGVSLIFSSATVVVTPRAESVTFNNDSYTAKLDATDPAELAFEVLSVKQSLSETVEATEEQDVQQKASGKIVIYNNFSTAPQRLINNTRFEANNGKIYRINGSVIVPGQKVVSGKKVPGSVEATVYADQPGDSYNIRLADLTGDFKIPGFKGEPRYDGFYARQMTDITGGYVGRQRIIADALRQSTEIALREKLKEQLLKELYAVKPENYLFFAQGYSIDYAKLPDTAVGEDKAKINIEGSLNAVVFNSQKLAKYMAVKLVEGYDGLPVEFIPGDGLLAEFSAKDESSLWKNSSLQIKLTGDARIKWLYDTDQLKRDLVGKKSADLPGIVARYGATVSGIDIIFTPVWTRHVSDNLSKIKVQENF